MNGNMTLFTPKTAVKNGKKGGKASAQSRFKGKTPKQVSQIMSHIRKGKGIRG